MYVQDQQGRYVNSYERWFLRLRPYYPLDWTDTAYHCPGYKGMITAAFGGEFALGSYAYNVEGVRPGFGGYEDPRHGVYVRFPKEAFGLAGKYGGWRGTLESDIRVPSEMVAIGESRFLSAGINLVPGGRVFLETGWLGLGWYKWTQPDAHGTFAFGLRHGKNYNVSFCDGHVGAMSPWLFFNPTNTAPMWNYDHQPHPELWLPE
jgi:prepilin-type processing-associated H-X9-DG protein